MILPVILSGGSGTRLWPLSRKNHPKQLLPLINKTSLLQDTINRLTGSSLISRVIIICNEKYRFMVAEQVANTKISQSDIVLEPVGRNTAPAIALAAITARHNDDDPVLLVLPADHVIKDVDAFYQAVEVGAEQAEAGNLVTFGIIPDYPETGFGYIKAKRNAGKNIFYPVDKFVEKPDLSKAEQYLEEGGYYWNSGMFMFKASAYLKALETFAFTIFEACQQSCAKANRDMDFIRIGMKEFEHCPSDSIDYAIMEKVDNAIVIPIDIGWSDVGSWSALHDITASDENKNILIGDVKSHATRNCYVRAETKLVTTLGVENLIIVDTDDALLVASRDDVQNIKDIVDELSKENRDEVILHKRVCRPWGCYRGIDASERFQVKRITVNPGSILSLQMHHHRSEHWIIVSGTAKVIRDEDIFILTENESTYIPLGAKHRLENIGKIPLEIIEVQTGSYLGEDDIVRFDDIYGREN